MKRQKAENLKTEKLKIIAAFQPFSLSVFQPFRF
jgi:hypothetical protein